VLVSYHPAHPMSSCSSGWGQVVCHCGVLPQHQPPTTLQADTCRCGGVMVFLVSSPLLHRLPSLLSSFPLPPVVVSPPSHHHFPSLLSLSPLPLVVIPPPTLQSGACSGGGGGITPVPLSCYYHRSTCNPPREQLLVRLGAGGVLCCWSSPDIVVMPLSSLS
jgi:hypothetical protein